MANKRASKSGKTEKLRVDRVECDNDAAADKVAGNSLKKAKICLSLFKSVDRKTADVLIAKYGGLLLEAVDANAKAGRTEHAHLQADGHVLSAGTRRYFAARGPALSGDAEYGIAVMPENCATAKYLLRFQDKTRRTAN